MSWIKIPYGNYYQEAELPDDLNVEIIDPPQKKIETDVVACIEDALDHPVGSPKLEDMVASGQNIVILVNDQTRPGPNAEMVKGIRARLKRKEIADENITIVIATGSHKGPDSKQLHKLLGGLEEKLKVHVHDCEDGDHIYVGTTKLLDVPIYLDRIVAEADFIITTGLISPHQSAGYSGGRKSIVPGVVSLETLKIHHSLKVRPYEPSVGFYDGNPFHEVAKEAANMVHAGFMLNVIQDPHKQIVGAVAGNLEKAHAAGVEICRKKNLIDVHGCADLIITSPGGAPRDIDLWQSQKALSVPEMICVPGETTFILVAEAKNGIPQMFVDWMRSADSPQDVIDRYRKERFGIGSNKAFMYARCMLKGRIILVSEGMTASEAHQVKMEHAGNLQSAIQMALETKKPRKVIVLPRAVNMIPNMIEGGEKL